MKLQLTNEQLAQEVSVKLPLGALLNIENGHQTISTSMRLKELGQDRPDIGEKGLHGIYAGVARGYNDELDGILEVLDEAPKSLAWEDAKKWAAEAGGRLPTRKEQALLFANVPELFKEEAYWSCEPFAGNESSAWFQNFTDGYQSYGLKASKLRARAVRRLPLTIE